MKKLLMAAIALMIASNTQAACKDLYFEKANILVTSKICALEGTRLAEISNQIKQAQCAPLSKHDIDMYLDIQLSMFSLKDSQGKYCGTQDAYKTVGAAFNP